LLVSARLLVVWLPLDVCGFRLVLARGWHEVASSSRSQIAVRTARAAVRLIWERPSINVRPRPVMNVPIDTQLVTRLASESVRGLVHAWSAVK
jgi:hypothetical protein